MQSRLGCQLVQWRKARSAKTMTYLISGLFDQPQHAFRFLAKEIRGGLTYVQYKSFGWSVEQTAQQIAHDICKNGYQATIYTISVGDKVARHLENILGDAVKVIAINPCTYPRFLKPFFYYGSRVAAPLLQIACHLLLGWLSTIPLIDLGGGKYSLILLADQLMAIAYNTPPQATKRTIAVICSKDDEFLQNDQIRTCFHSTPKTTIHTKHAQTSERPDIYLDAIRSLLVTF